MGRHDFEQKKWDNISSGQTEEEIVEIKNCEKTFKEMNTLRPVYDFADLSTTKDKILDYGCGAGWASKLLVQKAVSLYSIDISYKSVSNLKKALRSNNYDNNLQLNCDAEHLPFADNSFDFIFGNAILHHLDLHAASKEILRVMKPNTKAAFCEPFGHNPLMNMYRYYKDHVIEKIEGIHKAILYSDKDIFKQYFKRVEFVETSLLSDKSKSLRPVERFFLKNFTFTRRFASYITILLEN